MKTISERKNMYEVINTMILEKLTSGKMPWKQSWNNFGPARNYISKKAYRGINALILNNTDFEYPLYLTFLQVKELGGRIKKGSKSIEVIYWKTLEFANDDQIKRIPFLRYYNVFNVDCVEGIQLKFPECYMNDPIDACEKIVHDMTSKPTVEHGGDEPHYNAREDKIEIPHRENFTASDEYYATLFHELAHSTGHASGLNRKGCTKSSAFSLGNIAKKWRCTIV